MYHGTAILPTGTYMNPTYPETAEYYDAGQVCYIMRSGRRLRAWTSFGELGESWAVGTTHIAHHDQAGYELGVFTVIGIATFATGELVGETVNKKIPHQVFK